MKRSLSLTPTWKVVVALLVVAALGIVAYCLCWLRAWMPNVVVGAITVALTITVIEGALRREAQQRVQPHVDDVLRAMGRDFGFLVSGIAFDYADAPGEHVEPIPADAQGVIDLWLSTRHSSDRVLYRASSLIEEGQKFAERLEHHRQRDREAIAVDLLRAIDHFEEGIQTATRMARIDEESSKSARDEALHMVVWNACTWFGVFRKYAPEPVVLGTSSREMAEQQSQRTIRKRGVDAANES